MRLRHSLLPAALALLATAAAAQSSPYYIGISQSLAYEDNLIRLRDGQQVPDGLQKSDTVSSTALVAGIDQTFGRQRISGSGGVRSNRYSNNSDFNNQGYNLNLGLLWETIERLSGSVTIAADRALRADLRDRNGAFILGDNSETSRDVDLRVRLGVAGPWSLQGGLAWRRNEFSAEQSAFREYEQQAASFGLRWRPGGSTELGLGVSRTRVDYPLLLTNLPNPNDRRTTNNVDFNASWSPSAASTLSGQLSQGRTHYDPFPDRNFSATTGSFAWGWRATGKLRVDSRFARDIGQDSDRATTAYSRTTDTLRVTAEYGVSAKVAATAALSAYRRKIVGNGFFVSGVMGTDDGNGVSIGVRWTALRSLLVGCQYGIEQRNASDNAALSDPYKASSVSCFGQFTLQ